MKDPRGPLLTELEASLEDVLAALGGNGARERGPALDAARIRAETLYLCLREEEIKLGNRARPLPPELAAQVQAILRKDALIQSLAAAAKQDIESELSKVTQLRSLLRQRSQKDSPTGAGRSCDVRG